VIPKSLFEAFATNEILQIVIFSILFGVALAAFSKKEAKPIIKLLDTTAHVVLKMVSYIMWTAPLGVLGAVASAIAKHGFEVFTLYAKYLGAFIVGILILWLILLAVGYLILGKRLFVLLQRIKSPLLIAFSTTSSEAVFPKMVEELERFGCQPKIVSFTLPLGYSFNLDGSMMYMTFASIFYCPSIWNRHEYSRTINHAFSLMLTSKGVAGVPRASLIVVVATCAMFGIPPEGIALILPIDHFCDMARSMTNVLGNALSTAAIDKWESKPEEHKETDGGFKPNWHYEDEQRKNEKFISMNDFSWTQLLTPEFYINLELGGVPIGIYVVLFIIFCRNRIIYWLLFTW
ncbi:hypothetical protein AAG570_005413, partial [Ranatra chinensis]